MIQGHDFGGRSNVFDGFFFTLFLTHVGKLDHPMQLV